MPYTQYIKGGDSMSELNWLAKQFTFEQFQTIEKAIIEYKAICSVLGDQPSFESFIATYSQATMQRRRYEYEQGNKEI
jgi:hypothetical protein